MSTSQCVQYSRRSVMKQGLAVLGLSVVPGLVSRVMANGDPPWLTGDPDHELNEVGHPDWNQPQFKVWGWKLKVQEKDDANYDLYTTNVAAFNDPGFPGDHTPRLVRVVRAKPQQIGALSHGWHVEQYYYLDRGANKLNTANTSFDNDDQFFFAQMRYSDTDWRNYNASPESALSSFQMLEGGNAIRIKFGGTQPIEFVLRGHYLGRSPRYKRKR